MSKQENQEFIDELKAAEQVQYEDVTHLSKEEFAAKHEETGHRAVVQLLLGKRNSRKQRLHHADPVNKVDEFIGDANSTFANVRALPR